MFTASAHSPLEFEFPDFGIAVLESHHAPDFKMRMQAADYFKILHPLAGQGQLHLKARVEPLHRNLACFIPPGAAHAISDRQEAPLALMVVCFRPAIVPDCLRATLLPSEFSRCRKPAIVSELRKLLRTMFVEQSLRLPAHGAFLAARLLEMLALFQRTRAEPRKTPAPLSKGPAQTRVAAWLQGGLTQPLLTTSIDQLAGQLQISRRSVTAAMRSLTGQSWLQWQRQQRIRHARMLLEQTGRSVASIAFESGFEDLSSFYRAFKKVVGTKPEKVRAISRTLLTARKLPSPRRESRSRSRSQ